MMYKQIKRLRLALGLTQQQFADLIAATQVTVSRWETGMNEPKGAYKRALEVLAEEVKNRRAQQRRKKWKK